MSEKYGEPAPKKGLSKWIKFGVPAAVVVILAAVLGGVLGSRASNNSSQSNASNANNAAGAATSSASSMRSSVATSAPVASATSPIAPVASSATATSSAATPSNTANLVTITPLPVWDWGVDKAIGLCIGNWLMLERWMDEDWFTGLAGQDAWDQWDFSEVLGTERATAALSEHYNTYFTEADMDTVVSHGINHLRVPMGFWSWIPTTPSEPYVSANEVAQLDKLLAWAYARKIYVIVDLHGLPGSQNGEQHSGHNTTTPSWFNNAANQARSDDLVKAVVDWLGAHPYRSVVSAIEPGNEFRPYTDAQQDEMVAFYSRSYTTINAGAWPVALGFHPGYWAKDPLEFWRTFANAHVTNPPSVFYTDHPYPGNFPIQTNADSILAQVCTAANKYLGYPVPVIITEQSLYTGIKTAAFEQTFYASQTKTWNWAGGAFYWSWRHKPSVQQLQSNPSLDYSQYSFITYINNGTNVIPLSSTASVSSTTTRENAAAYLASLTSTCGAEPANAAPYAAPGTAVPAWTAQASAVSAGASVVLQAPATAKKRRAFRA